MPKKLIEVALPLEAINREAAREKSIRHGHPSTLHLWWARRPLAACRAVLFSSLVDDPEDPEAAPAYLKLLDDLRGRGTRREKLFRLLEELVKWENSNDEKLLDAARALIRACTGDNPPPVLDPFCGGGSIPLEAQRLGLTAYASDLNPVAVLITKALIEIPPRFAGQGPVNPEALQRAGLSRTTWRGAQGLAADVRYYGQWMREQAEARIGHLYPKGPNGETVIAWLWARTVKCPNPACGAQMPLISSFWLSKKAGSHVWLEPEIDSDAHRVTFRVASGVGQPPPVPKTGRGAKFRCLVCGGQAPDQHIKDQGMSGSMGAQLTAVVLDGKPGRVYRGADECPPAPALPSVDAQWLNAELAHDPRNIWCTQYGLTTYADLFTPRQLVVLTTFSDLVGEAREEVRKAALATGMADDGVPLDEGGAGAQAYADAIATYLAFVLDKAADHWSSIASWMPRGTVRRTFARHAIPMVWDYVEANPFSSIHCSWDELTRWTAGAIAEAPCRVTAARVVQRNATEPVPSTTAPLISTDPPYYDNIAYADLSDFYYVWLREVIGHLFPNLFATLLVPKGPELVATPHRFKGGKEEARRFFEEGLSRAFDSMRGLQDPAQVMTVFYAFKQTETEDESGGSNATASTGWETMLTGLLRARFAITGTWPMRTERTGRPIGIGTNALASSIVLVCRPRPEDAALATRQEFVSALRRELPAALRELTSGSIAPVDLAQATIGPGMAVFSRYAKVLESDGSNMPIRMALQIINQELDRYLSEQDAALDPETRFCIDWFTQFGLGTAAFGDADGMARAKNIAVEGLVRAGVAEAQRGKVRLLRRDELDPDWDPVSDQRLTIWEATHHLIRALESGGEEAAARLLARLGSGLGETARALAYRLYSLCERKGWSEPARDYNSLVVSWPELQARAATLGGGEQARLLDT